MEKSILINADRFLLVSGQRSYFYQQKDNYIFQIEKTRELFEKCRVKKKHFKKINKEIKALMSSEAVRFEKEISFLREKVILIYLFISI